jgi:hypothetical protein
MNHDFQLPAALEDYRSEQRWVVHRNKVPFEPDNPSRKAKPNDPATWSNADTAISVAVEFDFDGIGLNLKDGEVAVVDIDHCRNAETGVIDLFAQQLVTRANTLTEVSPSGTGLHLFGLYLGEPKKDRKQPVPGANGVSVDSFFGAEGRYVTITGNRLEGTPDVLSNITDVMDSTIAELDAANGSARSESSTFTGTADFTISPIEPDDPRLSNLSAEWIELGTKGTGPQGIAEKYGGDRSKAVLAFCCECIRHGIADDVIASCLIHWKIGEHIRDQSNVKRALSRVIARAREFVADSELFKMNEKFCVLPINGKTRVVTWGDDPEFPGHQMITMTSSLYDFKALYDKYRHSYENNGETKRVGRGSWWINNPGRRQYDGGMRFVPGSDDEVINGDTLNLWTGFKVAARKPEGKSGAAGCQLFLDHCREVICSGDSEHYDYLIRREAFIAQRRTRSEVAVGLRTEEEGTGKGLYSRTFNCISRNSI